MERDHTFQFATQLLILPCTGESKRTIISKDKLIHAVLPAGGDKL